MLPVIWATSSLLSLTMFQADLKEKTFLKPETYLQYSARVKNRGLHLMKLCVAIRCESYGWS